MICYKRRYPMVQVDSHVLTISIKKDWGSIPCTLEYFKSHCAFGNSVLCGMKWDMKLFKVWFYHYSCIVIPAPTQKTKWPNKKKKKMPKGQAAARSWTVRLWTERGCRISITFHYCHSWDWQDVLSGCLINGGKLQVGNTSRLIIRHDTETSESVPSCL